MSFRLNKDSATVAVYLAMLEDKFISQIKEAKTLEELREHVAFFMLEHYQHELDMASIRLAGSGATQDRIQGAAEAIKAEIKTIREKARK